MEFLSLNRRRSSARNVPSSEERGETDVFAGYFSTAFHCIKAMFLTTDVFFNPLDIELQWSARIRTQYFDSRFIYIWKVIHSQKTTLAVACNHKLFKHSIFLSVSELENSIFLDLVLLCFTPQLLPTLSIDLLDSQLLILRQLHCHVPVSEFSVPSGIH